jgi:preprotein translocase subunit SecD
MKRGVIIKLTALVLLVAAAVALSIQPLRDSEKGILLGLDLRGGVHLVLQAEQDDEGTPITRDDIDKAKAIIENRVNALGVSEPIIQADYNKKRIVVDLAGVTDPDKAVDVLKTTAKLTFRDPQGNIVIEGADLKDAKGGQDPTNSGAYVVNLSFSTEGAQKFADVTTKLVGQRLGIYLDEELLTNPTVNTPILNGHAYITGYANMEDAAHDAVLIRSGSLPVSMSISEKRQVGASLGVDSLNKSIQAGIYGLAFIFLFMLVAYRLPGIVADFSLIVYTIIVMWIFWIFQVVLTLPGIAGLILSIGMAVDLNIIIYERLKEEIRTGKSLRASLEAGFSRAFTTVFDSNMTTLIAAVTLYVFGTGPIKGFALTLGIGILVSLFTAVTFTRGALRLIVGINPKMNTAWFGVRRDA